MCVLGLWEVGSDSNSLGMAKMAGLVVEGSAQCCGSQSSHEYSLLLNQI